MKIASILALLAAAVLAQAAGASAVHVAVNPQPLPPTHGDGAAQVAINPQPVPPGGDRWRVAASARPYIGETEKN